MKRHICRSHLPEIVLLYGVAISMCFEDVEGRFWARCGERVAQVNACPFCGAKAPQRAPLRFITPVADLLKAVGEKEAGKLKVLWLETRPAPGKKVNVNDLFTEHIIPLPPPREGDSK